MKDKRTSWAYFAKRRNVDLTRLLIDMEIKNYEQLKEWCTFKKVIPPEISEYNSARKSNDTEKPEITKKNTPKPAPKKRSYRKRKQTSKK